MAKATFGLNFDGFMEYAEKLDNLGEEYLKKAVDNAMNESKKYVNDSIIEAMDKSKFAFNKGEQANKGVGGISNGSGKNRRATGKAKKSVQQIAEKPIEWQGNTAIAYIGADLKEAPELLILALGTPHIKADRNLNNAIKVKGKYRKEASRIQQEEFMKVIQEATND